MLKKMSLTFWLPVLIASVVLFICTEAGARVCIFKIGGTCVFWSGSVRADLDAEEPENFRGETRSLNFTINAVNGAVMPGLVYCKSSNSSIKTVKKTSVQYNGVFGISKEIRAREFRHQPPSGRGNRKNAIVSARAKPDAKQLRGLNQQCKNEFGPNWRAIDFVPSEFETLVTLVNKGRGTVDSRVKINCTLPNPATLGWDAANNRPEERKYQCSRGPEKEE